MNKFYTLLFSGLILTAAPSFAQVTYTAVQPGLWHNNPTPNWLPVEPPSTCNDCIINLNVAGGGTITLNEHVVLTGNSLLTIGGTSATILNIPNSGATDSSHANSINLFNDGTNSTIKVTGSSMLTVATNTGSAGDYDGVFTSFTSLGGDEIFVKGIGFSPLVIDNNAVTTSGNPQASKMVGGNTLNTSGTLPVILAAFGARLDEGVVDLNWTTSLEINSDHFAIERSADAGASWDAIGTVPAHGNSFLSLNYSFTDSKPVQGTAEYRLRMVDRDGNYAFSQVNTIRMGLITSVSVYPNPARDFVNVTLGNASGFTLIRLYNQTGQLLQEKSVNNPGGSIIPLAVSSYPEGNYVIVVTGADGSMQSSKVLIAK